MSTKLDLRKELGDLYRPPVGRAEAVSVPRSNCMMIDGRGDPSGPAFQQAIQAIYSVAYTMKFRSKKLRKKDYTVMALEGLWWSDDGPFDQGARDKWRWTLLTVVPPFITQRDFDGAVYEVRRKKNPPGLDGLRLESFAEGLCVQTMHVGPYSAEGPAIALVEAFAKENGLKLVGKHHEIYLGDPRRASPARLRTIVRHPVAKT